jgi:hypothetical protein
MKKITLVLLSLFACVSFKSRAACSSGFTEIIVQIIPDSWPTETTWSIVDIGGTVLDTGNYNGDTICIPTGSCVMFTIYDQYGDGIIAPGGYWIYADGVQILQGSPFTFIAQFAIACAPGSFCTSPIPLTGYGTYTTSYDEAWYSYVCDSTGTYNISTCGLNTCNTQIWVYTSCPSTPYSEGPPGTYAYNDDANCGLQANLNVILIDGQTYLIRIGDNLNDCSDSVGFNFSYVGVPQGCMDPTACNYNPLAMVDDGSCIYYPNPNCAGPDLKFDSVQFVNSLSVMPVTSLPCDVDEGCVTGYGLRYVLTFDSKIWNIGTVDYVIGNPASNPNMFNLQNCHGHAHYEGYGDYRLIDTWGNLVPAGHKNGFCVEDLCGMGQFTCGNMGISVGCFDEYGTGTTCQWVDITDVPDGDYRLAIVFNSQHLPDALGRVETNFLNNATQVCINITRNGGSPTFSLLPNCSPYVDCNGIPGGTAMPDCQGLCNGPAVFGDVYNDGVLDSMDIPMYMSIIENNSFPPTVCNDLNDDSVVSVVDDILANWCIHTGTIGQHNHCRFPRDIFNPNDSAGLTISNINLNQQYIDIKMASPYTDIKGYQFKMHGIQIQSVVNMVVPIEFPADIRFNASSNEVFAMSPVDSFMHKSALPRTICRIYFSNITDTMICIESIREIVNKSAERIFNFVYGNCIPVLFDAVTSPIRNAAFAIVPNPAQDKALLHFDAHVNIEHVHVYDLSGKKMQVTFSNYSTDWYEMNLQQLPQGVYMIRVDDENVRGVARLVKL